MKALTVECVRRGVRATLLSWSALSVCLPSAQAQQDHVLWSLEVAQEKALERSPRIRSALAAREAAFAYRAFAAMPKVGNPIVNLRAMVGRPDDAAATYSAFVGLPFDLSIRRRAWRSEASWIEREADAHLQVAKNDVRAAAREAYVLVALGDAAQKVAEESAKTALEVLTRVQTRLDAQAATLLDVALSEREYAEAKANVARARRELVTAQATFRQVLGLPALDRVEVGGLSAPVLPAGLTIEQAVARAVEHRREMLALASAGERWRKADQRLRAEAAAPVVLAIEGERQGNEFPRSSIGADMLFELPVLQRNQGERAVAKGQVSVLEVERQITEETVAREAVAAFQRLEAALAELDAIENQATAAADRALWMTNEMLGAGAIDYFRLLAARRSAFELKARRVDSLREAWLSRISLERAMGGWEEGTP